MTASNTGHKHSMVARAVALFQHSFHALFRRHGRDGDPMAACGLKRYDAYEVEIHWQIQSRAIFIYRLAPTQAQGKAWFSPLLEISTVSYSLPLIAV